jgi:hypothetical protein
VGSAKRPRRVAVESRSAISAYPDEWMKPPTPLQRRQLAWTRTWIVDVGGKAYQPFSFTYSDVNFAAVS